jgi:DNA-directed RNA polymerase specialized sigma24 family protein
MPSKTPKNALQAKEFLTHSAINLSRFTSYARKLTGCQDLAHELTQTTIIKCYESIIKRGLADPVNYGAYLVGAIKLNHYYAQRGKKNIMELPFDLSETEIENENAHNEKYFSRRAEIAIMIQTYIAAHYSAQHTEYFSLFLEGLTYAEIKFISGAKDSKTTIFETIKRIKTDVKKTFWPVLSTVEENAVF